MASTSQTISASDGGRRFSGSSGVTDCRDCALRSRCISYGWMSPGGVWFENAVVLRPPPGCRGFVGRSADIRDRFGGRDVDQDAVEPRT